MTEGHRVYSKQIDFSSRNKIFEKFDYIEYTPSAKYINRKITFVRLGLSVSNFELNLMLSYWYPIVLMKNLFLPYLSFMRRGAEKVEAPIGKIPAIIHSGWASGYYHWVTETLPRAIILRDRFPDALPLIPLDVYGRYIATLEAVGFQEVLPYPDHKNAVCDRIVLTDCPKIFGTTSPSLMCQVRKEVFKGLGINTADGADFVYVSRSKSRGRKIANEDEIISLVKRFGGEIINFEDYDFPSQVKLMSSCKVIVGIHGAGLTNMVFMPPGGTVIELLPVRNGLRDYRKIGNSFKHQACYWRLSEAMGHTHDFILGEPTTSWFQRTDMADVAICPSDFKLALIRSGLVER
ncbi:glycosyltransferase family 61 protein [Aliiroseovarius sp. S1123]|uniref:glycosyltransferase family 61 protein n=1 Tax=Aliiroseovarius sp. S1123 TaxID=2926404 RepID=UPI001FF33378|nr:glycosyltransferase family 61 protein [Aliiroseovarius sp. S1123]MCK0171440.1 glycosyltransferase family 61 protein [Aliiroseovarius sp. S1123]